MNLTIAIAVAAGLGMGLVIVLLAFTCAPRRHGPSRGGYQPHGKHDGGKNPPRGGSALR